MDLGVESLFWKDRKSFTFSNKYVISSQPVHYIRLVHFSQNKSLIHSNVLKLNLFFLVGILHMWPYIYLQDILPMGYIFSRTFVCTGSLSVARFHFCKKIKSCCIWSSDRLISHHLHCCRFLRLASNKSTHIGDILFVTVFIWLTGKKVVPSVQLNNVQNEAKYMYMQPAMRSVWAHATFAN